MSRHVDENKSIHLILHDNRLEDQVLKYLRNYASIIKTFNHFDKSLSEPLSSTPSCLITSSDSSQSDSIINLIKRVQTKGLSIPVVLIATDDDTVYSAVKAMQAGAADFILQPIIERDFVERIDEILNNH